MDAAQFPKLLVGTMRLGVWGANLDSSQLEAFIEACVGLGLTTFDHADIYGHYTEEARFGNVLKRRPDLKAQIQLISKCGIRLVCPERPEHRLKSYDLRKGHILDSVDQSLRNLQVEKLDLLLLHRPDFLMNPQEIAEAFHALQTSGKVDHFGVSNFTPSQVSLIHQHFPIVTNQVEASVLHRAPFEDGTFDQCMALGLRPTVWSPYGGGQLFGNDPSPIVKRIRSTGEAIAKRHDATFDQILLAWLYKHPAGLVPVLGTTKIERLKTALEAQQIELSHEEWYEIWQAATGTEIP